MRLPLIRVYRLSASPVLVFIFFDAGIAVRVRRRDAARGDTATVGVGRTTGELSLQTLQVRCRRAVLELTSDLCLLCLSPASAHGVAPSRTCGAAWGNLGAPLDLVFLPGTHSSARIAQMLIRSPCRSLFGCSQYPLPAQIPIAKVTISTHAGFLSAAFASRATFTGSFGSSRSRVNPDLLVPRKRSLTVTPCVGTWPTTIGAPRSTVPGFTTRK